jgi:replicative DNA helicase
VSVVEINAPIATVAASPIVERSVLGAIIMNNSAFNEAAGQIGISDFFLESHRRIFGRMAEMSAASKPIDMVTLVEELHQHKELSAIGGVAYVSSLIEGVPDRPSIEHYVRIVKEKSQLRALLNTARLTIDRIVDGEGAEAVSAGLMDALLDVESQSGNSKPMVPEEFMQQVMDDIQKQNGSQGLIGLPTGLPPLDHTTGGLRRGELVVLGARPGAGKSALATQIAIANAEAGTPVGFFSLEMSRWDLGRRFLSAETPVPAFRIRDPRKLDKPMWDVLCEGSKRIKTWNIHVDDNGSLTINELIARAKLMISQHKVKLIIVDYLQLVRAPELREIRERVGYVANALRLLAKSEQIPVVLLSQLRRPERVNDEPTLIDLKESGEIEAHAHVVLLIHAPVEPDMRPSIEQKILIAKNRNGIRGQIQVVLNDGKLLFFERVSQ